jgi:hypothetical protein
VLWLPGGIYTVDYVKPARKSALIGMSGFHGDGIGTNANAGAKLIGIAGTGSGSYIIDVPGASSTNTIYTRISGFSVSAAAGSNYDYMMQVKQPIGCDVSHIRMNTTVATTGGIKACKDETTPGGTYVNWFADVIIELPGYNGVSAPEAASKPCLWTETSATCFAGCHFTGGITPVLRTGSGIIKMLGCRLDHATNDSDGANIKSGYNAIVRSTEAPLLGLSLIGCFLEQCTRGQILVDQETSVPTPTSSSSAATCGPRSDRAAAPASCRRKCSSRRPRVMRR